MTARGYIGHDMQGGRSAPQSVQQRIIRQYCEQNGLEFCLSATEFEGQSIMLNSIKEDVIVMYSIWNMPKDREARQRLYDSGKEVHFAAENMKMDAEKLEIIFGVINAGSSVHNTIACLKSTRLLCKDERGETRVYAYGQKVQPKLLGW